MPASREGDFPQTRPSLIEAAAGPASRDAWEVFYRQYASPLYAYLRRSGVERDDALDILHDFFIEGLEGRVLADYDPARGRLREFLLGCLRHRRLKAHRKRDVRREKERLEFIDPDRVERRLTGRAPATPEEEFEREWMEAIWTRSRRALEERFAATGDVVSLRLLGDWVLSAGDRPAAAELARELGITPGDLYTRATRLRHTFAGEVESGVRFYAANDEEVLRDRDEVLRSRPPAESGP